MMRERGADQGMDENRQAGVIEVIAVQMWEGSDLGRQENSRSASGALMES